MSGSKFAYPPGSGGGGGGSGDVVGPASAVDNAIARFDTTTGKLIQNSGVTIDDNGQIVAPTTGTTGGLLLGGDTNLFRSAADLLKTDDGFYINNSTGLGINTTPTTSALVNLPSSTTVAAGGILWGTDTNLYRSAADQLATDDVLDVSSTSASIASGGTGVGDKISLFYTAAATAFGIGVQTSRLVLFTGSGGGVSVRAASGTGARSSGTDAITLLASGAGTFTGKVTAPSLQITTTPTSGHVLTSDASGNATWQAPGSGSGITRQVTVTSGSFTAGSTALKDYIYLIAGAHNATMPTASGNSSRYTFKNNHSAAITVTRAGSDTIEGSTSISIAPGDSVDLISNNTAAWYVI